MKKYFAAAALLLGLVACDSHRDAKLEDTTWKLVSMDGIPAQAIDGEADYFTLSFNAADTTVSGRTNCNRFFGKYETDGRKLDFENMGMTRMACPDMQYEDAFVRMLDEVDRYEIRDRQLVLYDDAKKVATFRNADADKTRDADGTKRK